MTKLDTMTATGGAFAEFGTGQIKAGRAAIALGIVACAAARVAYLDGWHGERQTAKVFDKALKSNLEESGAGRATVYRHFGLISGLAAYMKAEMKVTMVAAEQAENADEALFLIRSDLAARGATDLNGLNALVGRKSGASETKTPEQRALAMFADTESGDAPATAFADDTLSEIAHWISAEMSRRAAVEEQARARLEEAREALAARKAAKAKKAA